VIVDPQRLRDPTSEGNKNDQSSRPHRCSSTRLLFISSCQLCRTPWGRVLLLSMRRWPMELPDTSLLSQLPQENMLVLPRGNDQRLVSRGGAFRHPSTERRAHILALYTNLAASEVGNEKLEEHISYTVTWPITHSIYTKSTPHAGLVAWHCGGRNWWPGSGRRGSGSKEHMKEPTSGPGRKGCPT
jgi:hypothetical protein